MCTCITLLHIYVVGLLSYILYILIVGPTINIKIYIQFDRALVDVPRDNGKRNQNNE